MKKNILITGGSGFIGSHIVDALVKKKYKVTILDLSPPRRKDVKFIRGSILNKSTVQSALKNTNIIFHLAAVADINLVKQVPKKIIETNVLGTTYLLEASRKANVKRFIYASSYYSYGTAGNLYTTSKKTSELIIENYKLLFGLDYTVLRYSTVYGPRNREADAISIFVNRALKNLNLTIHGSGQQKRNYLYVDDLTKGSMLALKDKTKNKIITLASKSNIKIIDLARIIIKLTNSKSQILFDKKNQRVDDFTSTHNYNNLGKNLYNWKPKYNIIKGLNKYIKGLTVY